MADKRESNVELLRCILVIFVIVLHYNHRGMGGAMAYVNQGSTSYYFLYLTESFAICAVDTFVIISGYFSSTSNVRKVNKALNLILACIGYKVLIYLFNLIIGNAMFEWKAFGRCLIPDNWFVILYITLYFISLYINIIIERLNKKQYECLLVITLILFCVWCNIWDLISEKFALVLVGISTVSMNGGEDGYTIVNFVLLYLIAGYMRKWGKPKSFPIYTVGYVSVSVLIFILSFYTQIIWHYNNVFVILQSVLLFRMFECMRIGYITVINMLAKGVFSVYLLHTTFFPIFKIPEAAQRGGISMIVHMATCAVSIFLICSTISLIIRKLITPIERKIYASKVIGYQLKL